MRTRIIVRDALITKIECCIVFSWSVLFTYFSSFRAVAALALDGVGPEHSDKADNIHANWDRQHCHLTI